ncbi:monocarboxylate transporter 13-like [Cataglyphis hispanica]|uniref:monocarboxylate transporter 13-like n=1 Tax=Cataglyphis hispanica TaxID=1086592 RepID=UPI00217F6DFE|nr:monocarboxylate transporter 13-like [Cataglyphis hispanica]
MSTKVPPDGGWGWIIVLAGALNGISTIPIIQIFGLIYKDYFAKLNMNATDISIIINVNLAFGMMFGMINGALLKTFGYQKVAIAGSVMYTVGVMLTAFANTFTFFLICYGMLTSIGLGMSMSGFSLAINTYFTTRRNRAMALAVTITGLGPILMPQVASFLLAFYGVQETVLILGAYSLHSMIGALLLEPVKWHMKRIPICLETIPENSKILSNNEEDISTHNEAKEDETNIYSSRLTLDSSQRKRKTTISSIDHDVEVGSIYGFDIPLSTQVSIDKTMYNANDTEKSIIKGASMTNLDDSRKCSKYSFNSAKSVQSINLGSSIKIFDESILVTKKLTFIDNRVNKSVNQNIMEKNSLLEKENSQTKVSDKENYDKDKDESATSRYFRRIANLYDFDLLRDPTYINIMLGMSIAIFAEINFSMLTPFILADMGMTRIEIANIMSVIAIVDLVGRGVSPYLGEWLRQPSRIMYMLSLFLLIISRTALIFTKSFLSVLIVAMGLGLAKGIRSVYMTLVVPSYVPIHKLPSASGIQMLTNGVILTCAGPTLGLIRDSTGNYTICIILINFVTIITLFMWTIEILLVRRKSARRKSKLTEIS